MWKAGHYPDCGAAGDERDEGEDEGRADHFSGPQPMDSP